MGDFEKSFKISRKSAIISIFFLCLKKFILSFSVIFISA